MNASGKVIQQLRGNNQKLDVDISSFSAGLYFVRLEENGRVIIQKL